MSAPRPLPPWPVVAPTEGSVRLRRFRDEDAAMARELATDPYVAATGTLERGASAAAALAWVIRQQGRHRERIGFSFAIADAATDEALGQTGLWLTQWATGRATAGYGVAPSARGRGVAGEALVALTRFAWTIPELHRVELYIEPWNVASVRTAERAGYAREGLLRSHQEIAGARRDMLLYAVVRGD